jgi:hypothetical protein
MDLTLKNIEQWAYGNLPAEVSSGFFNLRGDPDYFDHEVSSICGDKKLLELASDPKCKERYFFANLLAEKTLWIYKASFALPFHFARSRGIMKKEEYIKQLIDRAEIIYELCEIIDSMRNSDDDAIQALYEQLLDFRHEAVSKANLDLYIYCAKALDSGSLKNFKRS